MAFPGTYNFNYYRGDRFEFIIQPKASNNTAFDLTSYAATFTIANKRGSLGTQYSMEAEVTTANNTVTCLITPEDGSQLAPGTYVYDVEISKSGSFVYTLLTGTVTVTDQITGAIS
jgi:glycine cleavage system H lipoate-binding protein